MSPTADPAPVPTDAEAFDVWARGELDAWRLDRVREVAAAVWADPASHPSWRAVAGIWLAGDDGPPVDELVAAADAEHLPPFFAARLRAVSAAALGTTDAPRAFALLDAALDEVRAGDVDRRTHVAVLRTAAEVALRAGALGDALAILDEARSVLGDDATAPIRDAVIIAALQLDVIGAAVADQRSRPVDDDEAGEERDRLLASLVEARAGQARAVAAMALAAADDPAAITVRLGVARVLVDLGLVSEAEPLLVSVVDLTAGVGPAQVIRFQALLALADVRLHVAGPEAALAVQREAVAAVAHLGTTPLLAWARRGEALQLRAAGRHEEADVAFATAIDLLHEVGQPVDALLLAVERAAGLGRADRPDDARATIEAALAAAAELPEADRALVEPRALDAAGALASARLDHDAAVGHWLRLVELARAGTAQLSVADPRSAAALETARAGRPEEAEGLFDQAEVDASDGPDPEYHLALVLGRRARVRRSDDEHEEAAELLRVAVNHARVAADPTLLGRLSLQLAEALEADGRPAEAVDVLLDARAEGEAAGEPALVAAIDQRLAQLGVAR